MNPPPQETALVNKETLSRLFVPVFHITGNRNQTAARQSKITSTQQESWEFSLRADILRLT